MFSLSPASSAPVHPLLSRHSCTNVAGTTCGGPIGAPSPSGNGAKTKISSLPGALLTGRLRSASQLPPSPIRLFSIPLHHFYMAHGMAYFTDTRGVLSSPVGSTFLCLMKTSYCRDEQEQERRRVREEGGRGSSSEQGRLRRRTKDPSLLRKVCTPNGADLVRSTANRTCSAWTAVERSAGRRAARRGLRTALPAPRRG